MSIIIQKTINPMSQAEKTPTKMEVHRMEMECSDHTPH